MTAETYTPRRALPTANLALDALLNDLDDHADTLDQRATQAGGRDRSVIGQLYAELADEIRELAKRHS